MKLTGISFGPVIERLIISYKSVPVIRFNVCEVNGIVIYAPAANAYMNIPLVEHELPRVL